MGQNLEKNKKYKTLLGKIGQTYAYHKTQAVTLVNQEILQTYWTIGQHIVEFEQAGKMKAEYGKELLIQLAKDLKIQFGKGFSRSNLYQMRQFYLSA